MTFFHKHNFLGNPQTPATPDIKTEPVDLKPAPSPASTSTLGQDKDKDGGDADRKTKSGIPQSQAANYSVSDCWSLVKTLVCGVKVRTSNAELRDC